MTLISLSLGAASGVRVALTEEDPEKALTAMLESLAQEGIRPVETSSDEEWLVVEHAGRRMALVAEVPPDASSRELLSALLLSLLMRAAECVEHRRVCERMEMLTSASFEGIMIHVDGVVIDANQRLGEILGRHRSEMLGDTLLRESVASEDLADIQRRMVGGVEGEYLITGVRKDGTRFRAELLSKQGKLGERPVRVVAVRDVTQREHTSTLLRESETQLRNLTEQVFDVVVTSRDGVILGVAGRIEEMLGFESERLIGALLTDFVAPCALPLTRAVIAERRVGVFESVVLDVHGASIPVEIVGVQSTLGGEPVRVAGLRDLRTTRRLETERLALRTQVERSQRLESLGVLAGVLLTTSTIFWSEFLAMPSFWTVDSRIPIFGGTRRPFAQRENARRRSRGKCLPTPDKGTSGAVSRWTWGLFSKSSERSSVPRSPKKRWWSSLWNPTPWC